MGKDLVTCLPSEIILNILLRLPIRATMICKCVCKPWLDLLTTPEFVKSHLSKSVPCLAVETHSKSCETLELPDEHRSESSDESVFNFKLPFGEQMHSSINGLIFVGGSYGGSGDLILCNPVTRECITLPCPQPPPSEHRILVETYGFGVSRMTDQFKLVKIFVRQPPGQKCDPFECQVCTVGTGSWRNITPGQKCDPFECQVCTVGTGSWRNIPRGRPLRFFENREGVFLNGNLHWLVFKLATNSYSGRISCLNLETEVFGTFYPPPDVDMLKTSRKLSVLRDSLCVCDNAYCEDGDRCKIEIWLMKEYGDGRSWTKDFIICEDYTVVGGLQRVWPIKVFKDGDILMEWGRGKLFYYSNETKSIDAEIIPEEDGDTFTSVAIYAPSFLSLKSFAMENVSSF